MQAVQVLALLVVLCGVCHGKRLVFENRLGSTIWVGSLGNSGKPPIKNGGWAMPARTQMSVDVADNWAGRFWARTGCKFDRAGKGRCETGDCDNGLQCDGNGGEPPATLAEFTFQGDEGQDFYDISIDEGFNIPAKIKPINKKGGGSRYHCRPAACRANLNRSCPDRLRVVKRGKTVACRSACFAENRDDRVDCCDDRYDSPQTCNAKHSTFFNNNCPDAYFFAYNGTTSTFTCDSTGYKIQFG